MRKLGEARGNSRKLGKTWGNLGKLGETAKFSQTFGEIRGYSGIAGDSRGFSGQIFFGEVRGGVHIEYAQAVWSPYLEKHIKMIENVQIRATSLVDGIGDLCYEDRLKKLNLPSLKYRRKRGDMIEMFKHFNKYDKHALSSSFQPRPRVLRKHKLQVYERIPSDGCRGIQSNSFYYRTERQWNTLPKNVAEAKTIDSFKYNLDTHWKNIVYV